MAEATVYRGRRIGRLALVEVFRSNLRCDFTPARSQALRNHSPDGFEWGFEGSGPAQLALAILLDVTEDRELALALYQEFKRQVVATWPQLWSLDAEEVRDWIAGQRRLRPELAAEAACDEPPVGQPPAEVEF